LAAAVFSRRGPGHRHRATTSVAPSCVPTGTDVATSWTGPAAGRSRGKRSVGIWAGRIRFALLHNSDAQTTSNDPSGCRRVDMGGAESREG
jgi:hypothetical protein